MVVPYRWLVVLFFGSFTTAGFIDVQEDRLVSVDGEEIVEQSFTEKNHSNLDIGGGTVYRFTGEDRSSDSKEMLLPLLAGMALKIFSVMPLIFGLLGWVAGLGLATGKIALILSGGLAFYYYLSQNSLLLPPVPVTKHHGWDHSIGEAGVPTQSQSQFYRPQHHEEIFYRDRAL